MQQQHAPLEAVRPTSPHRVATVEAEVTAAWIAHHDEVYAFLTRTTRDPDAAQDLLQEAFLRRRHDVDANAAR